MKSLFVLFLLTFLLNDVIWAQSITINKRNVPLEKVLKVIRKQSGHDFIGDPAAIRSAKPVTIQIKKATLNQALDICFTGQELTYSIKDKTVIIQVKKEQKYPQKQHIQQFLSPRRIRLLLPLSSGKWLLYQQDTRK